MNNEWKQPGSDWYAPLQQPETPREPAPKKKKGMPLGLKILLGTMLVVGLIALSARLFSDGSPAQPSQRPGFWEPLPTPAIRTEDELPEDWKDFFDSFYTVEDNSARDPEIPVVEKRPDWELKLAPADKEEMNLQEIYRSCVPSIVGIRAYEEKEIGYYWGSGIILSEDGLILTNAHMIEGCNRAEVILQDDTVHEALLVGYDRQSDLAVLKIEAKGLTPAVFGDSDAPKRASTESTLPISRIEPRSDQPRSRFDDAAMEELTESIRQHGLIQPILVRPLDTGGYQIVAGERRWRAARMLGLDAVPVNIRELSDAETMQIAIIENLQRENLNPIEEADGYNKLIEKYGMTQDKIAKMVGRSRSAVANSVRLLSLPESDAGRVA